MLDKLLPPGSVGRRAALAAAAVIATLIYTQVLLPGRGASAPRGTPAAILFLGLVVGMINGLSSAGLVLVYRSTRVINWAQTALGAAGAILCFDFISYTRVPFPFALGLGILLAGLVGVLFEIVFVRRFFQAPRLVLTVVTILAAGAVAALSPQIGKLPFFPKIETLSVTEILGIEQLHAKLPFAGFSFHVGSLPIAFRFAHIFAIEAALVSLLALAAFFRFTKVGVGVRALAENTERASLLGISVAVLSMTVWGLAGILSGISVTLTGFTTNPASAGGFAPAVLITALAAAVIARMRSIPIAVLASVVISVLSQATSYALPKDQALVSVALFVVIGLALLLQRRTLLRTGSGDADGWRAVEEPRPIPKEMRSIGSVRAARIGFLLAGLAAVVIYPFAVSTRLVNLGGVIALSSVIILSLVILTGWAGQVSLGQWAFAAVGAVVASSLTGRVGITFWLAVPIAAVFAGGFAVLIGIPALRIRGLFLAVSTFALAFAAQAALFNKRYFGWMLPNDDAVKRPTLFFIDFTDEKSMYFLCLFVLIVALVIAANLRRSRFGRLLIAVRDNEANVQSFGVSATRMKLMAFGVSGAMAGFAGAVFVHQQQALQALSYGPNVSLQTFILGVLGGLGSVTGAMLGSLYGNLVQYWLQNNQVVAVLLGFGGPLLLVYLVPGGLISVVTKLRDSVLRIIAQRRQLVVPSLFADYDPDALEARLIQLGEPQPDGGLAALAPGERWRLRSELYQGDGERIIERLAPTKESKEAAALTAATESTRDVQPTAP